MNDEHIVKFDGDIFSLTDYRSYYSNDEIDIKRYTSVDDIYFAAANNNHKYDKQISNMYIIDIKFNIIKISGYYAEIDDKELGYITYHNYGCGYNEYIDISNILYKLHTKDYYSRIQWNKELI